MLSHRSRGQVLPIWSLGIATALIFAFAALQYGQVLRWQIRAQNAADAAAAAALSVQASAWNQQIAALYAASLEEYRLRNLTAAMVVATNDDPSCGGAAGCDAIYQNLKNAYSAALARYRTDLQLINRITQYTQAQARSDAAGIVNGLSSNCGQANGGDCAVSYTVTAVQNRAGTLNQVLSGGSAWAVAYNGQAASAKPDYVPLQIEVVACAQAAPLVPPILGFTPPSFTAVGRAAATTAMVTQEWIQPGHIVNPATGKPFQPVEDYRAGYPSSADRFGHDWFRISFDGNAATAYPASDSYVTSFGGPHFEAVTGWWSTIPIKPFTGALSAGSYACKAS